MDAKRLEELAVWAETEANALDYEGSAKASERLRDLARCAAAWAKVERAKEHTGNYTWCIVSDRHGFTLDTAIAAVEAAQEVKP